MSIFFYRGQVFSKYRKMNKKKKTDHDDDEETKLEYVRKTMREDVQ